MCMFVVQMGTRLIMKKAWTKSVRNDYTHQHIYMTTVHFEIKLLLVQGLWLNLYAYVIYQNQPSILLRDAQKRLGIISLLDFWTAFLHLSYLEVSLRSPCRHVCSVLQECSPTSGVKCT